MSNLKNLITSSFLLIADSIGQKLVGLVSTVILARILLPEDFGMIAIAMIFMGFSHVLSETGSMQYLLRTEKIDTEVINTAWTISICTRLPMAVIFIFLAYPISLIYDDSRLTMVIIAFMLIFVMQMFRNPGEVYLKRAQTYQKIVVLNLISKVFAVATAISVAIIYKSYWALVAGQFIEVAIGTIGSFVIQRHKLKLTLSDSKEQWSFSKWMIPQSVFGYVRTQLDTIMVSLTYGKAEIGSFHTMKYLAYLPSANFLVPAMNPLLVELSHFKNDKVEYSKRFNSSFLVPFIISIPITSILFFYHELVTVFILGPQWTEFSLLLGYFSLLIPSTIMFATSARTLLVYARSKILLVAEILIFVTIYGTLLVIGFESIEKFTFTRAILENIMSLCLMVFVSVVFTTKESAVKLIATIVLLTVTTIPSYYLVELFPINSFPLIFLLGAKALLFTFFYFLFVLIIHVSLKKYVQDWVYTEQLIKKIIFKNQR